MNVYEIIIITMTICSFILALLIGIACYNWGRYDGYLAGVKDERKNKHYRTKEEFGEYKKESLKRELP